jgi:uncharacterized protein YqgC (DUF456 family)
MSYWLALGLMLLGLMGALLPGIPGAALVWLVALIFVITNGFQELSPLAFAGMTLLGIAGASSDLWVGNALGRLGGASWQALLAGTVLGLAGLVVGFLFAGVGAVPGLLIGTMGGIILVEWRRRRRLGAAARAGAGWLIGYLVSSLVEFVLALLMVMLFAWQVSGHL